MKRDVAKWSRVLFFLCLCSQSVDAQFLMDMIDTSTSVGKGMLNLYSRFDRLRLSGYIQPQFQVAQSKGAKSFNGGDFSASANSRFMLRRSRIRFDYVRSNSNNQPSMQFAFQFDATERGVAVRDVWARLFESKWQMLAFTSGIFARPFGYELNLSSSDRESPERGRMSQTLMKTERDLGAMLTLESRRKGGKLKFIKLDAGFFNGQGLSGPMEFDSHKDFISRLTLKPVSITKSLWVSAGFSILHGGIIQSNRYIYKMASKNGTIFFEVDSSLTNINTRNPRQYYGLDAQLKWKHKWGNTELRAEYWFGKQTASANSSETPGILLSNSEGYYIRSFNGAFFYILQNIINTKHQVGLKYDWYDPNSEVSGTIIGTAGSNFTAADIRFSTVSAGYNFYINENVKLLFWYDVVLNEKSALKGYTSDLEDNVLTCRLQYRF